mgnify:CR=1 FL=1
MVTDPKTSKFTPRIWFSLLLVGLLLVSVAITQFAAQETRDSRTRAAGCSVNASFIVTNPTSVQSTWSGWDGHYYTYIFKSNLTRDQATSAYQGWQGHSTLDSDGTTTITATGLEGGGISYKGEVYLHQTTNFIKWSNVSLTTSQCSSPPPATSPNLIIQNGAGTNRAVDGPTSVTQGQTVSYTFKTKDIGSGSAGASTTVVENYGSGTSNSRQTFPVGSLASGGSVSHTFATRWDQVGSKPMLFRVDAFGDVAESTEGDNDVNLTVTVNAPPSLPPPTTSPPSTPPPTTPPPSSPPPAGGGGCILFCTPPSSPPSPLVPPPVKTSGPKLTPVGQQPSQPVSSSDITLNFAANTYLKGGMEVIVNIDSTGVSQKIVADNKGGSFILKPGNLTKAVVYRLTISSKNSLVVAVPLTYADNLSLSVPELTTGDFNNDNQINQSDLDKLKESGFKTQEALYDINYDSVVNSIDYSLLLLNLGKKGN